MSTCRRCHNLLPDDARLCPSCGAPAPPLAATEAGAAAQRRADRIAAFSEELAELRKAGVVRLGEAELAAVERFHAQVLNELVASHDIDLSETGKRLSLGLRLISLVGAMALAASALFFFQRIWGLLSPLAQVAILATAPILGVIATGVLGKRERSGYFATMAAMFAFACLALNLALLGQAFNLLSSPLAFLTCGAFALILAYAFELRLLLVTGLVSLAWFVAAILHQAAGGYWAIALQRPESVLFAGVLLMVLAVFPRRREPPGFLGLYGLLGMAFVLVPTVILAAHGSVSYLSWGKRTIEIGYQLFGFALSAGALTVGLRRRSPETAYFGALFFIVMLYLKFVDWWWSWMPKYLFFLIVSLTAVGAMVALSRLRSALATAPGEARP